LRADLNVSSQNKGDSKHSQSSLNSKKKKEKGKRRRKKF